MQGTALDQNFIVKKLVQPVRIVSPSNRKKVVAMDDAEDPVLSTPEHLTSHSGSLEPCGLHDVHNELLEQERRSPCAVERLLKFPDPAVLFLSFGGNGVDLLVQRGVVECGRHDVQAD